jgi:SAM-dependent methyltransferase
MAPFDNLNMSYQLARCKSCGFHFARSLPPEDLYVRYYSEVSKYDSQPSISSIDQCRIDAAVKIVSRFRIPKKSRIVDLGCGFGAFLSALRDAGWKHVSGVDPAPQSANQANVQFGLKDAIYQSTLSGAGQVLDLGQADLICLMAVLEHLPELRRDLGGLLRQIRPGGLILAEVPAVDLFSGAHGEPFGELSLEHIQFFSAQSMRNLFLSLGAHVIHQELKALPTLHSGSLFTLAQFGGVQGDLIPESPEPMDEYLMCSKRRWREVLDRVPNEPFALYGAGSHSARLVLSLTDHQRRNLVAVFDGNTNLHGKRFDQWIVQPQEAFANYVGVPVLISSFRSERVIAEDLLRQFPHLALWRLYSDD